jgi:hypothetical protein
MNEQRQQAYIKLIQRLLNCPTNDEFQETLAANQELVDIGFLQTIEAVAQRFSQQGDETTANRLQSLAMQLREALNLDNKVDLQSLSEEEIQTYYQFLMQVLQATADSRGNSQVVYPLLAKNTDKLDGVLAEILRQWWTNILTEVAPDVAQPYASTIGDFSSLISQYPLSSKPNNMEIGITGYQIALTIFTRSTFPQEWAITKNNLGNVYCNRIKGDPDTRNFF